MKIRCEKCHKQYDMIEHLTMLNILGKKIKKSNNICSECMKTNIQKKLDDDDEMKLMTWAIAQLERAQRNEVQKEAFDLVADLGHRLISINDVDEIIDLDRLYIMSGLIAYVGDQVEEILRYTEDVPEALDKEEDKEEMKAIFEEMKRIKKDYDAVSGRAKILSIRWRKFMLR